jgi:hypothetical protein
MSEAITKNTTFTTLETSVFTSFNCRCTFEVLGNRPNEAFFAFVVACCYHHGHAMPKTLAVEVAAVVKVLLD